MTAPGVVRVPSSAEVPWQPPIVDPFTAPWWAACAERRLLVRRCASCGRAHFYPRPACPHCWSADVDWVEAGGHGTLYSFSVVRENDLPAYRDAVPYVVALVDLDEGARMMTTLVDSDPAAVRVGAAVEVVFVSRGEWTFPAFRVR
jgi:uncharacterized OB-fold protein